MYLSMPKVPKLRWRTLDRHKPFRWENVYIHVAEVLSDILESLSKDESNGNDNATNQSSDWWNDEK